MVNANIAFKRTGGLRSINDRNLNSGTEINRPSLPTLVLDYLYRPTQLGGSGFLFATRHPKRHQFIVRQRNKMITPILNGIQIPRCDRSDEDLEKFQIIVLTLFKPWELDRKLMFRFDRGT